MLSSSNSSNSISDTAQVVNNDEVEETQDGTNWLTWSGYWGDKQLSKTDNRQFCAFGHCKFTDGPLGEFFAAIFLSPSCLIPSTRLDSFFLKKPTESNPFTD